VPSTEQLPGQASLAAAYARCERLARDHYENFPVASRLLPRPMRPHVAAVYAFARVADDFADEGERPAAERQRLLDDWLRRLRAAAASSVAGADASRAHPSDDEDALFLAIGNTIRGRQLPVALFEDLLSAFRQDTEKTRYETFGEVLDYCRRSANPVGRLVLGIAGYADARLDAASDCVCTALQLANFLQDLERDWQRGRLYVPLDELRAAGARLEDLDRKQFTPAWRSVMSALVDRTRAMFVQGRVVTDLVGGRLRLELRLIWLGGMRILERLEQQQFDVFGRRPALGRRDVPLLLWRAATWRVDGSGRRRPVEPRSQKSSLP
jgi:squalene synthase HpnC